MMYEHGTVYSLTDLMIPFGLFVQMSNSTTNALEILDDRIDTMYGGTVKIPISSAGGQDICYYASCQHKIITKDSYSDWWNDQNNQEFVETYKFPSGSSNTRFLSKYGSSGKPNIFKNEGEFVAIGLHTTYDENLYMYEQGQITCEKEIFKQKDRSNLLPWKKTTTSIDVNGQVHTSTSPQSWPVFPGQGCPWFVLSSENIVDCDIEHRGMEYYFTKTNESATITFNVVDNLGYRYWQSIAFGMLINTGYEPNVFPLYVGGGSGALDYDYDTYIASESSQQPTWMFGNVISLDCRNISMSNSTLVNATQFNDSKISNFRVLGANGIWQDVFAMRQTATTQSGGQNQQGYIFLNMPDDENKYNDNFILSSSGTYSSMVDNYFIEELYGDRFRSNGVIEPVVVVFNPESLSPDLSLVSSTTEYKSNLNGIQGSIPNVYITWSRNLPEGEVILNGHKYLSVPNVWSDRLKYYPVMVGDSKEVWESDKVRERYMLDMSRWGKNILCNNMLILLE